MRLNTIDENNRFGGENNKSPKVITNSLNVKLDYGFEPNLTFVSCYVWLIIAHANFFLL